MYFSGTYGICLPNLKGEGEKMGEKAKSEKMKITHQVKRIRDSFEKQTQCIQCRSRAVRIIGKDQYFCADCCTEFKVCGNKVTVYTISTDGGLMKIS